MLAPEVRGSPWGSFFHRGLDVSFSGDVRDREERAARNQSLFREISERIEDLNEGSGLGLSVGEWICECANDTCTERVSMTTDEYESVRKRRDTVLCRNVRRTRVARGRTRRCPKRALLDCREDRTGRRNGQSR